jgi:hypothetical protein
MKQVIKLRALPNDVEAAALDETLRACTEIRERFGLGAQASIRVIGKVANAYAALRANIAAGS